MPYGPPLYGKIGGMFFCKYGGYGVVRSVFRIAFVIEYSFQWPVPDLMFSELIGNFLVANGTGILSYDLEDVLKGPKLPKNQTRTKIC